MKILRIDPDRGPDMRSGDYGCRGLVIALMITAAFALVAAIVLFFMM